MYEIPIKITIPTDNYANIQPEVTGVGETFEDALSDSIKKVQKFYDTVITPAKFSIVGDNKLTKSVDREKLTCAISKTDVFFDKESHTYVSSDNIKYLSGSVFSDMFKKDFDSNMMSSKMATKYNVNQQDIKDMWELNGDVSKTFGTAIHKALELYGKYLELSIATKGDNSSALHKNPVLRNIVIGFYKGREKEDARYELFIADEEERLCGSIDRILIVNKQKKIVRIQDFKTNPDINKKCTILEPFNKVVDNTSLGAYWLQASFYGYILEKHGYSVEGLDIFNYNGEEWVTYTSQMIDIKAGLLKASK